MALRAACAGRHTAPSQPSHRTARSHRGGDEAGPTLGPASVVAAAGDPAVRGRAAGREGARPAAGGGIDRRARSGASVRGEGLLGWCGRRGRIGATWWQRRASS